MGGLDMGQIFPALLSFQHNEVSMYGQQLGKAAMVSHDFVQFRPKKG